MTLIENQGEIAIGALTLIGASTKEGDTTKIGFFGSGAKYAIATLLRNGIAIRIFSGLTEITVNTVPVSFGGQTFEQVYINGLPTSYTTRMGPSWEVWFAVREFICNAMDEGGYRLDTDIDTPEGAVGVTRCYIGDHVAVSAMLDDMGKYLRTEAPLYSATTHYGIIAIVPNPDNDAVVYRKGIRVSPMTDNKALFRYDFDRLSINESRLYTLSHEVSQGVASALAVCDDDSVIRTYIQDRRGHYEEDLYWCYVHEQFSDTWSRVLGRTAIYPEGAVSYIPQEDVMNGVILPDDLVYLLKKQFPSLNIWNAGSTDFIEEEASDELKGMLQSAFNEAVAFGYLNKELPLVYGTFINSDSHVAAYNPVTKVIQLSIAKTAELGYDELVATLIEEGLHNKGYSDGSRAFELKLMRDIVQLKRIERKYFASLVSGGAA